MKSRRAAIKKTLYTFLIIILSFSLLSMVFSAIFFRIIFHRVDDAPIFELSYSDIDADRYQREAIPLFSYGNQLSAYLYSAESPKALLILAGGIGADCDAHLSEVMYFVDHGYSVLCYSPTGVGESGGEGIVGLNQPALDLSAALKYAEGLPLPLVVYGHSAGAYAAAVNFKNGNISACVLTAGFDSPSELMWKTARDHVGILADIEYPFMCIEQFFVFGSSGFERASDCLRGSNTPVLIVHDREDSTVPYTLSISAQKEKLAHHHNARFLFTQTLYADAHTSFYLTEDSARYRQTLKEYETVDKIRANTLDDDFMRTVTDFFDSAVGQASTKE